MTSLYLYSGRFNKSAQLFSRARSTSTALRFASNTDQRWSSTKTEFPTGGREAKIGIVFAQQQAIFGTTGKHAIRLADAARCQIVNQHTDVGFMALRVPLLFLLRLPRRVQAGKQTLCTGFFVAGCAVDLARKIQAGNRLWFPA